MRVNFVKIVELSVNDPLSLSKQIFGKGN